MSSTDKIVPKTISYSALSNWSFCSYYYLLVDVQKLKPFKNTPDTVFGKWIHTYVQLLLQNGISEEEAIKQFERRWKKFCNIYKLSNFKRYGISGKNILSSIKKVFDDHFRSYKVVSVEHRISVLANPKWSQQFKGFIDIILELPNGNQVIIDFKTADSSFFFQKYQDSLKDYQLSLYKHFYCSDSTSQVDFDKVSTAFVVLEKNDKSKNPVVIIPVSSGPKKIQNALELLSKALSAINRQIFLKNRSSCFKFSGAGMSEEKCCVFYNSQLCPKR